jgi:hypothetical protein
MDFESAMQTFAEAWAAANNKVEDNGGSSSRQLQLQQITRVREQQQQQNIANGVSTSVGSIPGLDSQRLDSISDFAGEREDSIKKSKNRFLSKSEPDLGRL